MKFTIRDERASGFTEDSFTCRKCGVYHSPKEKIFSISVQRNGKKIIGIGNGIFEKGTKMKLIRAVKQLLAVRPFKFATLTKCPCSGYNIYFTNGGTAITSAEAVLVEG